MGDLYVDIVKSNLDRISKPARYIESRLGAPHKGSRETSYRFALAYPDIYEIGASNSGMAILGGALQELEGVLFDRVFLPWIDFLEILRETQTPLISQESRIPLNEFDAVGITLQHELNYTNVLEMLDISNIPLNACDRGDEDPIVIAGGPCAYNPAPMSQFMDAFFIGEADESIAEIVLLLKRLKSQGISRAQIKEELGGIAGIYVPDKDHFEYHSDGRIKSLNIERRVNKEVLGNLDCRIPPDDGFIPLIESVHEKCNVEIMRGCCGGCRFCVSGYTLRPQRERSKETILKTVRDQFLRKGYDEISLSSLNSSGHSEIEGICMELADIYSEERVSVSLPSLKMGKFSIELAKSIQRVRREGLTFAPEAGSERLRKVINKRLSEDEIMNTLKHAYKAGWRQIKLYFMIGLPTETDDDIDEIASMLRRIRKGYGNHAGLSGMKFNLSINTFIPKHHTPFQWEPLLREDMAAERSERLKERLSSRWVNLSINNYKNSIIEACLARGDSRIGDIIKAAWNNGAIFDNWTERFKYETWKNAFASGPSDIDFYAFRRRDFKEILPWDMINVGIDKGFFEREYRKAVCGIETMSCSEEGCCGCGACSFRRN